MFIDQEGQCCALRQECHVWLPHDKPIALSDYRHGTPDRVREFDSFAVYKHCTPLGVRTGFPTLSHESLQNKTRSWLVCYTDFN